MVRQKASENIRILIVDDHPIVREGLRGLIENKDGMVVVGEAEDGIEAVIKNRSLQPDMILMDIIMPRMGGLEAIKEIKKDNPDVKILVLTSFIEDEKLQMAIHAGAQGYLLKDSSPQELVRAIRDVFEDKLTLHPAATRQFIQDIKGDADVQFSRDQLTQREIEILKLVARGFSNREIAKALCISDQTTRSYVTTILNKLNLSNRTQAVLYALRNKIIHLDDPISSPPDSTK
jgi:NarL family two-component system response regulator LiaR